MFKTVGVRPFLFCFTLQCKTAETFNDINRYFFCFQIEMNTGQKKRCLEEPTYSLVKRCRFEEPTRDEIVNISMTFPLAQKVQENATRSLKSERICSFNSSNHLLERTYNTAAKRRIHQISPIWNCREKIKTMSLV